VGRTGGPAGNTLSAVSELFHLLALCVNVWLWILVFRFVVFWIPAVRTNAALASIAAVAVTVTEPPLSAVRKVVPPFSVGMGVMDLAPLVIIVVGQWILVPALQTLSKGT